VADGGAGRLPSLGREGATARIVHLTSKDLKAWTCGDTLDLGSDRVIDASVAKIGDRYRLWYKDERKGSRIVASKVPTSFIGSRTATSRWSTWPPRGPRCFASRAPGG
jgi:hypothetical protein